MVSDNVEAAQQKVNNVMAEADGLPDGITKRTNDELFELLGDEVPLLDIAAYMRRAENEVLVLGHGIFSFSTAVSWFRQKWTTIQRSEDIVDAVRQICKIESIGGTNEESLTQLRQQQVKFIQNTVNWEECCMPITVDTNSLRYLRSGAALFFLCPWLMENCADYTGKSMNKTEKLIDDFITSASGKQKRGDLLFLAISCFCSYFGEYGLNKKKIDEYSTQGYEFLGCDSSFVKEMIKYGYRHSSKTDYNIHETIGNYHFTLCFRRK
jgi:hypothetical protein